MLLLEDFNQLRPVAKQRTLPEEVIAVHLKSQKLDPKNLVNGPREIGTKKIQYF